MQSDDPPFLLVGTEVSAKFKGAFCEAKVKKIVKSVKCKVLLKEAPFGSVIAEDTNIRGKLELNQFVEITQGKNVYKGVIQYIKDCSTYTVVFNDGDERVLRRTQVCLKGARHFDEAVNLDSMPLYHPESFASSISSRDMRKRVLKRKAAPSNMSDEGEEDDDSDVYVRFSRSSQRSSSIVKSSPTVKASPSLLSLRASVRRSASVTPVKNGLAARSSSRTAVLKPSKNDDLSKSPTPTLTPTQSRAGSVAVSAKRVIHNEQSTAKSPTASEPSDDERRGDVNRSLTRSSDKAKSGTDKNVSVFSLPECTSKNSCAITLSDASLGVAPALALSTSSVDGQQDSSSVTGRRKDRNAAESLSGTVDDDEAQAHKLAQLSPSTSRLMTPTIASREKAVKPADRSSLYLELSKSSSATVISSVSSLKQKETKKDKSKQNSTKSVNQRPTFSSSHEPGDNAEDSDDGSAAKKYLPGSVVVINEFGPPKVGGRIHLGMVVSMKEYKTNAVNVNKMPQPQSVGKRQIPVRSFQNGRYHAPYVDHLSTFNPVEFRKLTDASLPCVKIAFERANLYYMKKELPQSWEKRSSDTTPLKKESADGRDSKDKKKSKSVKDKLKGKAAKDDKSKRSVNSSSDDEKPKTNADAEVSGSSDESSSDEEEDEDYNERRDRFVAHFYKFQDESGNPMNRVPVLGGREIDLYRFYDVVNRMGGHKRVTIESCWRRVLTKLRLEDCSGATPQTVKNAYLRYFEKFEFFMKHLGYSSLNDTGSSSRSSRTIRTMHESDWKKNAEKRKEKRAKEKTDGGKNPQFRASSKDSSVEAPSLPKIARLATPTAAAAGEKPTPSDSVTTDKPTAVKTEVKIEVKLEKPVVKSGESDNATSSTPTTSTILSKEKESTKGKEPTSLDSKPAKVLAHQQQQPQSQKVLQTGMKPTAVSVVGERKPSTPSLSKVSTPVSDSGSGGELPKKVPKRMPSPSSTDVKTPKIKKESREGEKSDAKSGPIMRTKSADMTGSSAATTLAKKPKHMKPLSSLKKSSKEMTSSDEDLMKHFQKRRSSASKEGRVKSPSGHQAVEDQDVGYSNANIFTRFYQGQKVHARHYLRFYDARIVIVKQPSLADIAKSLVNAFEVGRITHTSSPRDLNTLNLDNMGAELKDALKNMVNATKCFVHYLGWNSRYDEWLMLHKIRVDEKDEKASTKALDALIPNELPPQLFVVAMDWCLSADGISSLATTHAYASDQQRPRRLSSSSATRTSVGGVKPSAAGEPSTSTAATGSEFRPSKFSVSHHRHSHHAGGNNAAGTKSAGSSSSGSGKPFAFNNPAVVASFIGASSMTSSSHLGYQSPLNAPSAVSRSPSSSSSTGNLLMVSTTAAASSATQPPTTPKAMDSGHSSPLSPVLQHQRLLAYQQFHHQQNTTVTSTHGFDESATIRQRFTTESGKFTIPHLQKSGDNQLSRTSSSSSIERASTASTTSRSEHVAEGNASFNAFSSPLLTTTLTESVEGAPNLLVPPSSVFSGAAPIDIQYYQNLPFSQSVGQHPSSTLLILSPPPSLPLSADKTAGLTSMLGDDSSAVGSSVLPRSSSAVNYFVGEHSDEIANSAGDALNVHVTLTKSEESTQTTAIYPCTSTLMSSHTVKHDGICSEEHCVAVVKESIVGRRRIFNRPNELVVHTSVTASSVGETATSALLLVAASSTMGGRSSPLTTVSSCGAVEDFDENSSLRHTETPVLNDDDECASIASVEGGGGKSSTSKLCRHSPVFAKRRETVRGRYHSKSPSGGIDTISAEMKTDVVGGRPMRRRMPSSKSPESSGAEDNYEEQITHTDTSHAVRLRVQQRMEAEHLFTSYSFIGQPELEDLVHESSCEDNIKVMEDRLDLLRDIYQTFRGKLTRLERRHKRLMTKKKQQVKDVRERDADDMTGRNRSLQPAVDVDSSCGGEGDASKFVSKTKAEAMTALH